MGLQNDGNTSGAMYLNVSEGKLVRTHKGAVEGVTVARVNKNGRTVHEEKFDSLSGYLSDARVIENDYGKQWQFMIIDVMDRFIVCLPYSSRYATTLLRCLPNVDLKQEVVIKPYSFIDEKDATKKVTGLTIYQGGEKVQPAYTKENPNGLPQMQTVRVKGVDMWDTEAMDLFLEKMCKEKFEAHKQKAGVAEEVAQSKDSGDMPEWMKL